MRSSTEFINPPAHVSQAVTDTVETFAQKRNQKHPDAVQLEVVNWYHDAPIWFVKTEETSADGKKLVRRVQIGAFETSSPHEQTKLHFFPDAYKYNPAIQQKNLERLIETNLVINQVRTVEIFNRRGNPYSYHTVSRNIKTALTASWDFVSQVY